MPRQSRNRDDKHFVWQPGDVQIVYPPEIQSPLSEELHTVLWTLEHVTNQQSLDDAMMAVAGYMTDDPTNKLVPEALRRAEERVKRVTS